MSEKSSFRGPFNKQHGKRAQTLLQSWPRHLYHIYWSLWKKFNWKKSILVLCKTLRLFVNTLIADDKSSLVNRDNFSQPIQMLLIQKQNTFSQFFSAFLKSKLNFEHFSQKDDPNTRCIFEITDSKKGD